MASAKRQQTLLLRRDALANELPVNQTAMSEFEHQSDIYISTLRKILAAMGAELRITARFPEVMDVFNQFDQVLETANP